MSLAAGFRLGPYEIVAPLGAGGMGEVYRAKDTKLGRDVALKILPDTFTHDLERLARFRREAQALASLNHPHIGAIYGLDEAAGRQFLVLELVDGETLDKRIARAAIPVDQGLPVARQIAEALEAAHEKGIIHRDLKPSNIALTSDGQVKVLDFGLAKLAAPEDGMSGASISLSMSPTITSPLVTGMGVLLGTAAYMSPEQAKGKEADKQSDIWGFGCVLFEMLTGRQAFQAETVAETIAAILMSDADLKALPRSLHPKLEELIRRCLAKNRKDRWHAIADVRVEIETIMTDPQGRHVLPAVAAGTRPLWTRILPIAIAAILVAALTHLLDRNLQPRPSGTVARFSVVLPENQRFSSLTTRSVALAPDGTAIVYVANQQLYIRAMGELEARPIRGTSQSPNEVFFSPDGRWIGFVAERKLKKIAITGGAPVVISDLEVAPTGASWSDDDQIFIGQGARGIVRVSAVGGKPETVVTVNSGELARGPQLLPGGDALLFTLATGVNRWDNAQIVVHSLKSAGRTLVLAGGSDARYLQTGHLVYALGPTLLAVRFDVKTLKVIGGPVPVIDDVLRSAGTLGTGGAQVAISANGSVVYIPQGSPVGPRDLSLTLVDRSGTRKVLKIPAKPYSQPRLSPNGKQLAVGTEEDGAIWIYDLNGTAEPRRLTFDGRNMRPTWTLDSQRVVFAQSDAGLFWQRADGTGAAERLAAVEPGTILQSESWSPDGKILILDVRRSAPEGVGMLSLGVADPKPSVVIPRPASNSALSSDGHWLAYTSNESGRNEVYVQPFPTDGSKHLITTNGGDNPLWSPDGRELFYLTLGVTRQIVSVDIHTQPSFTFGKATPLPIEGIVNPGPRGYDITPNGEQFLVMFPAPQSDPGKAPPEQLQVVLNWFEELKQRVPSE